MAGVKKSERRESKLDALHLIYQVRKQICFELMTDFGAKSGKIPQWLIEEERKRILNQCQDISIHIRAANEIWPLYWNEFKERRLEFDRALASCEKLQDELQAIVEMIPTNKNRYTQIVLKIDKVQAKIKRLRQTDNRFIPKLKDYSEGLFCSAANFGNVNSNGNLNGNNGASNVNGVRRDFTDQTMDHVSGSVNGNEKGKEVLPQVNVVNGNSDDVN